jgi:hypothetical protein
VLVATTIEDSAFVRLVNPFLLLLFLSHLSSQLTLSFLLSSRIASVLTETSVPVDACDTPM